MGNIHFINFIKLFIFERLYIKEYTPDRVFYFMSGLSMISLHILSHLCENSWSLIMGSLENGAIVFKSYTL